MNDLKKGNAIEAAQQFIAQYFPHCDGALLAGSVVRGEATETSDLDIVVFDHTRMASYRESIVAFGWAIEVFVHNLTSYKQYFHEDYKKARPSMPRMVSEGIVLKDNGILDGIKNEAKLLLDKGPEEWTEQTVKIKQYFITDALDDFIGCSNKAEELFIANALAELVSEFVLRTNRQWIGHSKWVVRALLQHDEAFTLHFIQAFDIFYKTGNKQHIIQLVNNVLEPFGGKYFDGFSVGK
ncbi:nucleotidyltransferase domain-containing protein [Lysinibacillus sp. CD3-6]|uniref:nucleotidyltransferase domain-containing protein n=1 Tax=Lysinibacillus sp. CD3-6 TaxID=2892541 RepID=UPI001174430D|nr:nucleotidyltransferase domain-containing protein [Lysinibacillus sp. CD3-6]UED82408.1 nucleotidyltransferase domain-containing protein [Lysinibacillus sp. CD3-6]